MATRFRARTRLDSRVVEQRRRDLDQVQRTQGVGVVEEEVVVEPCLVEEVAVEEVAVEEVAVEEVARNLRRHFRRHHHHR